MVKEGFAVNLPNHPYCPSLKKHSTSLDLVADLPEKISKPLVLPERTGEISLPKTESASEKA
jgi:hypothetical protein